MIACSGRDFVRKQRIPARGLKRSFIGFFPLFDDDCQKTTNPRKGIETQLNAPLVYVHRLVRKQRIPARGLKPSDEVSNPLIVDYVRKQRIPARGLKRSMWLLVLLFLLGVRKQRIPARGLKQTIVMLLSGRGTSKCQKTTNPRKGIETLLNVGAFCLVQHLSENNESPQGD